MGLKVIQGGGGAGKSRPHAVYSEKILEGPHRLFFAFDISDDIRKSVADLVNTFELGSNEARFVKPENLHITLKFLGETPPEKIKALKNVGKKVAESFKPFELRIGGMGVFPNHDRPRVLWLGVSGDLASAQEVETQLSGRLENLGFEPDQRAYTPHLTTLRIKDDRARGKIARLIRQHLKNEFGKVTIDHLTLYESSLNPLGSVYRKIERFYFR